MSSDLIRKVPMISPMLEITDRCHGLGRRFAPYRLSDHPISATTRQITQSSFVPSWSTCPRDGFKSIVVDVFNQALFPRMSKLGTINVSFGCKKFRELRVRTCGSITRRVGRNTSLLRGCSNDGLSLPFQPPLNGSKTAQKLRFEHD